MNKIAVSLDKYLVVREVAQMAALMADQMADQMADRMYSGSEME